MTTAQIEAFRIRIEAYLEHDDDKKELAVICRCAAAYMEHVENVVDTLDKPDIAEWMQ